MAGSAFTGLPATVKTHEVNTLVRELANQPGKGRVMVVDGGGSDRRALMGDVIAGAAAANGWAGVVIFGAVRDVAELRKLDLGIMALARTPAPLPALRRRGSRLPLWSSAACAWLPAT